MKCQHCSSPTDVLETRAIDDWVTKRRRKCTSGCKPYWTYEVLPTVWAHARHRHKPAKEAIRNRSDLKRRNALIVARVTAGEQQKVVAADFGLSPSSVYLVIKEHHAQE